MRTRNYKRTPSEPDSRSGLTLLELVIVLTILAALGGLLIPVFNGYRKQTSDSSAIDSLREISKVVSEYEARTNRYPNNFDSLVEAGTETSGVFSKIPATSREEMTVYPLDQSQTDSLALKGITHVYDMNATVGDSATFQAVVPIPRTAIDGREITSGSSLIRVDDATVFDVLGASPRATSNVFVVFGFGDRNSLVGSWIQEAPFHSPEFGSPNDVYSRYAVVFEIPAAGGGVGEVRFVGTILFDHGGIRGVQSLAEDFYNVQ